MPFTEPTRQTQPEEFRSSAMMHVQQREPAPRRSYESASTSTSGSSTSTAASTSVTDFHQVYVKGQPQAQEGRREERGG